VETTVSDASAQVLQGIQKAVATVFALVATVWQWSAAQIHQLASVPWQQWPLSKQIVLAVVAAAVVFLLFKVAMEFFAIGERIIAAFVTLFTALVRTVPLIALAGLIAVGGLWVLTNADLSGIRLPVAWQTSPDQPVSR
jgi:hypothetical protein